MTGVLVAGLLAGIVTTVAGMGGGLMLTLVLLTILPSNEALTITGPALLVGNLHRLSLYRAAVSWPHALRCAGGGLPGAFLGGLLAVAAPEALIHTMAAGLAVFAAARTLLGWAWQPPRGALIPGGVLVGVTTATGGAGGLLLGPMLLSSGLSGRPYVATAAVTATAVHVGRLLGYGVGGWVQPRLLGAGLVLAGALLVGNLVGDRLFARLPEAWVPRIEIGVSLVCVGLALAGLV